MEQVEYQEALTLMTYCTVHRQRYPEAQLLVHIPNEGKRNPRTGAMLKAIGLRKGFPDYILPVARGVHHGLALELKAPGKRASHEQLNWLKELQSQGWSAHVAQGAPEAWEIIRRYLECGS